MDALLMLIQTENAQAYQKTGDFYLDNTKRLTRRKNHTNAPYVYSGVQIIKTDLLKK